MKYVDSRREVKCGKQLDRGSRYPMCMIPDGCCIVLRSTLIPISNSRTVPGRKLRPTFEKLPVSSTCARSPVDTSSVLDVYFCSAVSVCRSSFDVPQAFADAVRPHMFHFLDNLFDCGQAPPEIDGHPAVLLALRRHLRVQETWKPAERITSRTPVAHIRAMLEEVVQSDVQRKQVVERSGSVVAVMACRVRDVVRDIEWEQRLWCEKSGRFASNASCASIDWPSSVRTGEARSKSQMASISSCLTNMLIR